MKVDVDTYNGIVVRKDPFVLARSFPEIRRTSLPFTVYLTIDGSARATAKFKCTGYTTKPAEAMPYASQVNICERLVAHREAGRTSYFWRVTEPQLLKEPTRKLVSETDLTSEWYYITKKRGDTNESSQASK
jgi:hypothetical protein